LKLLHEQNIHLKPRVLIVEDEPLIALALEEALMELGFSIAGTVSQIPEALDLISREVFDVALLDVNLGLQKIDPVADVLAQRQCPFVFTTGYDRSGLPRAHSHRAVLEKPFHADELAGAVCAELERAGWHVTMGPNA
jgi:CheY-like chemotaxis protein